MQKLFFIFSEDLIVDLSRFTAIVEEICALATDAVTYEYDSLSLWWQNIREILLESPCALMSLLAAMMCRNHAARYRKREVSSTLLINGKNRKNC